MCAARHHFRGGVSLKVCNRAPMGLVGATPPAVNTVTKLARVYEVARQNCVIAGLIREAAQQRLVEDRDIPEGAPIRPADRRCFGHGLAIRRKRLLVADLRHILLTRGLPRDILPVASPQLDDMRRRVQAALNKHWPTRHSFTH